MAIAAANLTARDPAARQGARPASRTRRPRRCGTRRTWSAAPFDPTVGAALAGAGTDPASPSYLDPSLDIPVKHDSQVARRQDALGSLLWRGLHPDTEPRSQILAPPLAWSLQPDDAQAILTAVASTIHAGLAVPRPLTAVIAETNARAPAGPVPLPDGALGNPRGRFDDGVVSRIAAVTGRLWGLTAALTTDERTGLTGAQYTAPLREDMLRALSQSVPPDARNGLAQQRLTTVGRTVDDLFGAVTIVNPGGSYTLATEHSPLPLALRNDLPVPIRVRLQIDAPPGMSVTDMGEIELPPGYLPLKVPIEVHFTQRVAVDVALRTADGLPLGEPVRLSVHSNAYGKVLFFITLSGGRGAGRCWPAGGCGTGSAASPTAPTSTGRTRSTSRSRYAKDADEPPRAMTPVCRRGDREHRRRAAPAAATAVQPGPAAPLPAPRHPAGLPATASHAPAAAAPRARTAAAGRTPGAVRRGGGVPVVGHGVRDPGQPAHRLRPHRAAGHHSGCGAVECLLGGLSTAQPDRRPGARGDVHCDLRAGAGPRRARRPRRRRRVRAPSRHAGDHAAVDHHSVVGCVCPAARRADAGQRSRRSIANSRPHSPTCFCRRCSSTGCRRCSWRS